VAMMHAVLDGVSRDQFMARHKANHVQVVYGPDADQADRALVAKAAAFAHSAWWCTSAGRKLASQQL